MKHLMNRILRQQNSGVYQVNDQSTFEDALNKIASDNLSEIRLVLKGGSSFVVPTQDYVSTFGVANKKITVTSDGDNRATLHFSNRAMLSGSCTFDNVEVVGSGKFYCNGFDTVFTRNCELKLSETLYGGGYKSTVDHTHVVIAASGYINPGSGAGFMTSLVVHIKVPSSMTPILRSAVIFAWLAVITLILVACAAMGRAAMETAFLLFM